MSRRLLFKDQAQKMKSITCTCLDAVTYLLHFLCRTLLHRATSPLPGLSPFKGELRSLCFRGFPIVSITANNVLPATASATRVTPTTRTIHVHNGRSGKDYALSERIDLSNARLHFLNDQLSRGHNCGPTQSDQKRKCSTRKPKMRIGNF